MYYCMYRAGGNLLRSGEAEYISPIVFRARRAGQTYVYPMPASVPYRGHNLYRNPKTVIQIPVIYVAVPNRNHTS